ncbi:MAG: FG-GAP-like repeat-containing protein, partial [Bacteroidales bacterium]|nr:FG-GAP-like repeat-containing protein [Bacteroidales bacterium]
MKKQVPIIHSLERNGSVWATQLLTITVFFFLQSLQVAQGQPELNKLWEKPWEPSQGYWFSHFADFNSDGRTEFSIVINDGNYATTGQISILINQDNTYSLSNTMTIPSYSDCWTFPHWDNQVATHNQYFADADGDGAFDYLISGANSGNCSSNFVRIYWGTPGQVGFSELNYTELSPSSPFCVGAYFVDFNNDNLLDVYIRSAGWSNDMVQNQGGRVFNTVPTTFTGRDIKARFADYNQDGFKDLLYIKNGWADGQWGVRFSAGDGTGNFPSTVSYFDAEQPNEVFPIQLNPLTDNQIDIVFTCANDGTSYNRLYFGKYSNSLSQFEFYTKDLPNLQNPRLITHMDYNQDGHSDLIVQYQVAGSSPVKFNLIALINDGNGLFDVTESVASDLHWTPINCYYNNNKLHVAGWYDDANGGGGLDTLFIFGETHPPVAPPTPVSQSICGAGYATLTATATSQGIITWFDVATGGSPVATGSTFTTPYITETTTYYVAVDSAGIFSHRVAVDAVVLPLPANLSQGTGGYNLTDGLVAYYPFNGNANDESGTGNNGTVIGTVALTTDRNGNAASAYDFPGQPFNYITVPHSLSLSLDTMTLNAWIYTDTDYGYGQVVQKNRDIFPGHYGLYTTSVGGTVSYGVGVGAGVPTPPVVGSWHMVTGVLFGNTARFYVDGMLVADTVAPNVFVYTDNQPLAIGMHYYDGVPDYYTYPYKGKIDDVGIYNRVLSDDEVLCLYQGNCNPLAAYLTSDTLCRGSLAQLNLLNPQAGIGYALQVDSVDVTPL